MGPGRVSLPMPPPAVRAGGKLRRIIVVLAALILAGAAYLFNELGSYLVTEDSLEKSDAIFVLAGSSMSRPLDGADLYLACYAPRILLTRETPDPAYAELARRGLIVPSGVEQAREVLVRLGVPRDHILLPERIHDSTAAEAITLRETAEREGWNRVIVVTSKFHLRRAGFAMRRELDGTSVEVLMRGSRYDRFEPRRWWSRRADIRNVITEVPKLIAYVAGLGA